jgi:threonine synthase
MLLSGGEEINMRWPGLLAAYKEYLPINEQTPFLTLNEGNTPLVKLERLSAELGVELFVKLEGANPTGSFKDRGMVMAVAKAVEAGSKTVICASTGNTSASAAAYAARAGLRCIIVIPEGKIAMGKLAQAMMYGAEIISIEGNFDQALKMVRNISEQEPITLVNSVNPFRLEGQKTAAFEICEQLGFAPEILAIPVGNAGNISAYWKGFKEYAAKKETRLPKMFGFEAAGAAALVHNRVFENPETIATAIRIGNPASWDLAVSAVQESSGRFDEVSDEEILFAYKKLASSEGIFVEPASCASIAGILKNIKNGSIEKGAKIVAVLTGNGLKDPDTAINSSQTKVIRLANDENAVTEHIRGVVLDGAK